MNQKNEDNPSRTDVFSKEKRSAVMRSVRSRDTKPELILRKALHARGFRYRLNVTTLPGKPDLVFPKFKAVIFVHGCFWHGHDCKRGARVPKTNRDYWISKINKNRERDKSHVKQLTMDKWRVLTIWECDMVNIDTLADNINDWLNRS